MAINVLGTVLAKTCAIGLNESDIAKFEKRVSNVRENSDIVNAVAITAIVASVIIFVISITVAGLEADIATLNYIEQTDGFATYNQMIQISNETLMNSTAFDVAVVSLEVLGGGIVVAIGSYIVKSTAKNLSGPGYYTSEVFKNALGKRAKAEATVETPRPVNGSSTDSHSHPSSAE